MKYEFCSREWLAAVHGMIRERVRLAAQTESGISFSICEVFHNAPPHIAADKEGRVAWHCYVTNGNVSFGHAEVNDTQIKVIGDYADFVPVARYNTMGDPERVAEFGAMTQRLLEENRAELIGSAAGRPASIGSFHDAIAQITA